MALIKELRTHKQNLENQNDFLQSELKSIRNGVEGYHPDREYARLFISAIDQCSESIFFTDIHGKILYVNRSFEQSSGYSRVELLGETPRIIKSNVHPDEFYREMWDTILSGKTWRSRITNKRKDGTLYHEEASIGPVRNQQGEITSFVSIKTDISELLENKQALEKINAELIKSNKELEQFAYVASHDLQEPLRAVSSCMQLLQKHNADLLDDRSHEFIRHSVNACARMRELIDGLLSFSRVNSTETNLEPTDTAEVLDQVRTNLTHAIQTSGAVIRCDRLPVVCAHKQMLIHLFQNLLSNALKFCDKGTPHIAIRARKQKDEWVFSVTDNGIGIEPEHSERIFQLFQRLHTRDEYPGTGLGLAICQKIVSEHGGRIWVDSTPHKGSTFSFTMPAVLGNGSPCHKPKPKATHENQATPPAAC